MRAVTLRRRPVALLVVGLAVWLALYLYNIHGSSVSTQSIPACCSHSSFTSVGVQSRGVKEADLSINKSTNGSTDGVETAVEEQKGAEGEFSRRRKHYQTLCQAGLKGPVGDVHYYQPAIPALCLVPKASHRERRIGLQQLVKHLHGRWRPSHVLLNKAGLGSLVQGYEHARHVQEEVRMLAIYHFRL
ncbi:hypothetical protein ACOMHN_052003 [Nucella lapillus]